MAAMTSNSCTSSRRSPAVLSHFWDMALSSRVPSLPMCSRLHSRPKGGPDLLLTLC